jgi:hypothetical protein
VSHKTPWLWGTGPSLPAPPGWCLRGARKLLAHPLVTYLAELSDDQLSESPQYGDEWANAMALVHALAGSLGLLAMAEEGAAPRVLTEFTGPLSRAADVAAMERRLAGSRLALPPVGNEASMTLLGNSLP